MAQPVRFVFLSVIIGIFIFGVYDYTNNFESNNCVMTYMYQRPEYLKVPLEEDVTSQFPHYALYLYGEGKYASDSRSFRLRGIPVLFIPGNSGSYKQVRSLGSVALRKAMDSKTPFHFNYFSLDLNEELSGMFGGVLMDQAEFAAACIKHILTLYKGAPSPPKSVLVVGHSMGGMIARSLHTLRGFEADKVHTIVTQATPHRQPVIAMDSLLSEFYDHVNGYWAAHHNTSLRDVTVVSTGGGFRDILVRSELTVLNGIVDDDRAVSSNTMSVPRAFTSTDHLCHVWCKQIVMATSRALFDIVDKNTKQIAVNPLLRRGAFQHHLVDTPGTRQYKGAYTKTLTLDSKVRWSVRKQETWTYSKQETNETKYSVIKLPKQGVEMFGYAAVSNIDNTEWFVKCTVPKKKSKSSEERCHKAENLAATATMLPPYDKERKMIMIGGEQLSGATHLVAVVPKSKKQQEIAGDLFIQAVRQVEYNVTDLLKFLGSFPTSLMELDHVIQKTASGALFYNITLRGLHIPLQAYEAYVTATSCKHPATDPVLRFHVPWAVEDSYTTFRADGSGKISLKLQNGRPEDSEAWPELHIYPGPQCTYRVSVGIAWSDLCGQFVRFYGTYLPAFMVIQVLMSLAWQLRSLDEKQVIPSLVESHSHYAQPWRVVPAALIVRFMLYFPEDMPLASRIYLPIDDSAPLQQAGTWYPALPIMLYLVAYAVFGLYTYFFTALIGVVGRMLTACFRGLCTSPSVVRLAVVLQYTLLLASLPVAYFLCGTLAILVAYAIFFCKVLWSFSMARLSGYRDDGVWNRHNVNVSLFILLMLTVVLNAPALIVWSNNLINSSEYMLKSDPSRLIGITVAICVLLLTYANFPRISNELFGASSSVMYFSCVLMVVFCLTSIYRVSYFICTALLLISVPAAILKLTFVEPEQSGKTAEVEEEDLSSEEGEEIIAEPVRPAMMHSETAESCDYSDESDDIKTGSGDSENGGGVKLRKRGKKI